MALNRSFCNILLVMCMLLSPLFVNAQTIIKGKVTDAETGQTIPGASVYLNGTYIGTATDSVGKFTLKTSKTNIPLVVSFIGYQSQEITNYSDTVTLSIALIHKIDQLKEVKITYDGMSREDKMKIFLTEFIGDISKDCIITNPDVVWLTYRQSADELTAGADDPIIIKNAKLGYKITYYLSGFRHAAYQTAYQGNYVFAEDTLGLKPKSIQKILKARNQVYYGSRMHFIRSLWANQLTNNGFKVYKPDPSTGATTNYHADRANQLGYDSLIVAKTNKIYRKQKFLVFDREVYVQYTRSKNNTVDSYLQRSQGSTGTAIDSDGYYGSGIEWKGDMGFSRVNNLLPAEFAPLAIK